MFVPSDSIWRVFVVIPVIAVHDVPQSSVKAIRPLTKSGDTLPDPMSYATNNLDPTMTESFAAPVLSAVADHEMLPFAVTEPVPGSTAYMMFLRYFPPT
jgi:hypothetical protein